jgi:hypothetical protein
MRIAVLLAAMAKTLNSVGHTRLFTATPRVGNQNVTESSASMQASLDLHPSDREGRRTIDGGRSQ